MAARKEPIKPNPPAAPARTKPTLLDQAFDLLQRAEVVGVLLVLCAAFTLLSLLTGSRGAITGAWVNLLRLLVGSGVWLFPWVAGGLGVWVVVRTIEAKHAPLRPDTWWMRPVGVFVLYVAAVIAMTLVFNNEQRLHVVSAGGAGGIIGLALATALQDSITIWGAWVVVIFLVIASIIFLTDRWLIDLSMAAYWQTLYWAQQRAQANLGRQAIDPAVPLPTGHIPWWRRMQFWLESRLARQGLSAPNAVHEPVIIGRSAKPIAAVSANNPNPAATHPPASPNANNGRTSQPTQATPITPGAAPTPNDVDFLSPRIIGGGQEWRLPKLEEMLQDWQRNSESDDHIRDQGKLIQETLGLFGVPAEFEGAYKGPSVTQYLIKPGYLERSIKGEQQRLKVKVAKIASLSNDLALALAAASVRIEAPIPGTTYVGVEVPNQQSNIVGLKELMESENFGNLKGRLKIALGEDVKGQPICSDLARMPHLLIAGATGSGKSAGINSIISCLLISHTPDTLRFLMIDPKMVELSLYNGIPHLLSPVVTEVDKAAGVLFWAVKEMERRYTLCSKVGARDLIRYNEYLSKRNEKPLPYIVVIVDEMADLMMAAPEEVEKHICRLAQMARAVGIHLIIATQRPSVDVITGLIKANFPSRIAFAVTSQTDSRVILDTPGAERLLGRGDMLFMAPDSSKLERLQGTWVADDEISKIVRYWKGVRTLESPGGVPWESISLDNNADLPNEPLPENGVGVRSAGPNPPAQPRQSVPPANFDQAPLFEQIEAMKAIDRRDPLFEKAVEVVRESGRGSISILQRELRVGYNRAAKLMDQLVEARILGKDQGGIQGRTVLDPGKGAPGAPRVIGGGDEEGEGESPRVWM